MFLKLWAGILVGVLLTFWHNIQGDSGGVTATYGAHFWRHFEQKVSYKPGSYTQYLQSYVRNWKRTTVKRAWPSELLARMMHAATEIRDNDVNLRRATCAVHKTSVSKRREAFLKMCCKLCKIELQKIKSTEINLFLWQ
jgi:hypothetical protein